MILKIKLLTFNITSSLLLILFLCLGSQNLDKRYRLNLLLNETVELPSGFIIGIAFTFGFISGGFFPSSKWEVGSGSRLTPKLRGSINTGSGGRPTRTAKLNWFRKYVRGGELDRAIRIEMDRALKKSDRRTATRGFG